MSMLTRALGLDIGEQVQKITGGLDKLFTSDEERGILANKKAAIKAQVETKLTEMEVKVETFIQENLTERHKVDMASDSWLSKNIRPLSLLHITLLVDAIIALGYFGYTLEAALVGLVGGAWNLVLMFYFGGRSVEKGVKMLAGALKR